MEAPNGVGNEDRVLAAADARTRIIPATLRQHMPLGQEPGACFREARRVMSASQPHSTSSAAAVPPAPEELFEFISDESI